MKWQDLKPDHVVQISRVAAVFEVWVEQDIPIAAFKVKVLERQTGDFLAVPNIAVRNAGTRQPEWTSGLGASIEEALVDALKYFFMEIGQNMPARPLAEEDFMWADSGEF